MGSFDTRKRPTRILEWDGCVNVRDLGGLPTRHGTPTRFSAVVRGDSPDRLSPSGWAALRAYGIQTIVDLRNEEERTPAPADIGYVHTPLDGIEDTAFWAKWRTGPQFGTPLYYRPHLERFPDRNAAAVAAIARAPEGGVLVHCVGGRDRTGQISMLLLALTGVSPEEIAADYCLSGWTEADDFLERQGTSASEVIHSTLAGLDVEAYLRAGGVTEAELAALRARLVG